MNIIDEPKAVALDDSFSNSKTNSDSSSLIPDNFYESKSASIFDDDFQGIEWPKKVKFTEYNNDDSGRLWNYGELFSVGADGLLADDDD
ncbi:MAG: hypothetical protein EVG15_10820 [Candidatus Acididesulfobacter diazotrophicus]|uniref:Uncharacterized protein n=1 Tax=Candidatus Acididesulfobacter diazotrophicus TaxID=2597226 RepID=A0A519BJT4_9DELT|nr:MAG: hypothetical protein EVG15_10820 [Candidatus Acididesulfobacter diazotrophicus]